MTGADCIDIVLLHRDNILQNFFFRNGTPCFRTEFMAVHALKDNTFSV